VHKTRYRVPHENLIWEVDVFAGKLRGLVIAEVELDFSEQVIALPEWIGREISDDRRYSNSAMSRTGQIPSPALSLNIIKN
jgi:CYTH domain-containing protein